MKANYHRDIFSLYSERQPNIRTRACEQDFSSLAQLLVLFDCLIWVIFHYSGYHAQNS